MPLRRGNRHGKLSGAGNSLHRDKMKILGAGIALPRASSRDASACACDHAVKAARRALSNARCLASELDLIVSLSVSPSRIADAPRIVGPRLAHPVQRDLRATHAAVFDLVDADWTLALDFAQSHCRQLDYRRALVVRAEALADTEGSASSGLSDGAGAIVLTTNKKDSFAAYADIDAPAFVRLDGVSARHSHETGMVARFAGSFDESAGYFAVRADAMRAALRALVLGMRSTLDAKRFVAFHESWLRGWLLPPAEKEFGFGRGCDELIGGAVGVPPAFQLPAWLSTRTSSDAPAPCDAPTVVVMTLDVFKPRVACIAMEV
jgi:3-Oxoacyl-[acyl-carrier-protein (ACP)] synthase III